MNLISIQPLRGGDLPRLAFSRSAPSKPAVLTTWKDIAGYLGLGVRTVQRYEREFGMPVRRLEGKSRSAVRAYPSELDLWLDHRSRTQTARPYAEDGERRLSSFRAELARLHESLEEHKKLKHQNRVLSTFIERSVSDLQNSIVKAVQQGFALPVPATVQAGKTGDLEISTTAPAGLDLPI